MPQLCLNILEVKDIGAFHASGHVVAQHMEGGGNAQPFPGVAVVVAKPGRIYRLGLEHQRARAEGKSVILTFPARLGALPADFYGIKPDCRGEWLPVIIRALQKSGISYSLAEVLTGVYEAIAWGYGEELSAFDGLFDVSTIPGRQRILARRAAMEKMHHLSPALENPLAYIEGA